MSEKPGFMTFDADEIQAGIAHLRNADRVMDRLIGEVGPFLLTPERGRFQLLVRCILSQQISMYAARAIRKRLDAALRPRRVTVESLQQMSIDELRAVGITRQKSGYLKHLADHVSTGELRLRTIHRRSDEEVLAELTQVKGIGVWTAQMFLMFGLCRLDVLPTGDLGLRSAVKRLYELDEAPDELEFARIGEPWRPYATIACWYLWRSADSDADPVAGLRYPV